MMDMVFFPFSHVDQDQCRTLTAVFPHFQYLPLAAQLPENHPMTPWVEKKVVTPVFTPGQRLGQVESQVAGWLNWVELHKGNQRNLKALLKAGPYFSDDAGPFAIQSELRARIRQGAYNDSQSPASVDPLLFLKIAALTDAHNEAIDADLADLAKKQAALFSDLKGEPDPDQALPLADDGLSRDPGAAMTQERIRAWAACAGEEKIFAGHRPQLLITTSSAVFEYLAAISTQSINALDIDGIKVHEDGCARKPEWQTHFLGMLEKIVTDQYPKDRGSLEKDLVEAMDECRLSARIQVGVFSGTDLEKHTGLSGKRVVVCRVAVKA
ncbi:MAG: hypothetical protein LC660_13175 [Desulfobacteraceae bacterium]|nr:hypothetical protein [Desulfobacteraceae bacterium]